MNSLTVGISITSAAWRATALRVTPASRASSPAAHGPYYYFAQISGLYDTFPLLIITFVAINQPFTIWMLRSFFMEIPRLEEAAMIDG